MQQTFTVSEINRYIKEKFLSDDFLQGVAIKGEISNFIHHSSGHMYFTLKDSGSRLKCVMFKGKNSRLPFNLENGLKVIVLGSFSLYERDGQYQLYVDAMQPEGVGSLHLAFLQLKEKLEKEGLFAEQRKKALPLLPQGIGVITSPTGAAVRDIINVITRRMPQASVLIIPAVVQGKEAAPSLVQALAVAEKMIDRLDVLIIGRGGGSLEELWAFNEEMVVRAMANSSLPIVSAVGHETDFTIADFVADQRAPTPSAAAEIVTPDINELLRYVKQLENRLQQQLARKLDNYKWQLDNLRKRRIFTRPRESLLVKQQTLDYLQARLLEKMKEKMRERRSRLELLLEKLRQLSPLAILGRGYSVCQKQGEMLKSVVGLQVGETMTIVMSDGQIDCLVEEIRRGKE